MITVGLPKLALTDLRAPTLVAEFDLSCPAELIADPAARAGGLSVVVVEAAKVASPPRQALVLVRLHGEPIGSVCVALDQNGTSVATVREAVTDELAGLVARQFGADLLTEGGWDALTPPTEFAHAHAAHVAAPERVAVVLCTRERPLEVARCLASLAAQDHPDFSVWIIDNAPASNATRAVVEEYSDRLDLHYVLAPRPGLARARNVALAADLDAEVVAWIDDDEVADSQWLTELSRSLQGRPDADAVSGLVLPAELLTAAEISGSNSSAGTVRAAATCPPSSLLILGMSRIHFSLCQPLVWERTWPSGSQPCAASAVLTKPSVRARWPWARKTRRHSRISSWPREPFYTAPLRSVAITTVAISTVSNARCVAMALDLQLSTRPCWFRGRVPLGRSCVWSGVGSAN